MPMNRLPIFFLSAAVSVSAFAADQKFQSTLGLHFNRGSAVTRIALKKASTRFIAGMKSLSMLVASTIRQLRRARIESSENNLDRSSRAMAIVHIAIFDAVNAIVGGYNSYTGVQ